MAPSSLNAVLRQVRGLAARYHSQTLPDHELLERFTVQRDETAFAALVQRHGGMVLGVARRILHDSHAAEDVFQNTFLTLARRAGSIRKRQALASWLYGVAARLASQYRVRDARRSARERETISPRRSEDVTEAAVWRELGAVLDEELQRLPEKYRTPLVLVFFVGQTQEEAARQLGWSKGTLRRRLEQGKRVLHDRLLRRGVSLSVSLLAAAVSQSAAEALPAPLLQQTIQEALRVATTETAIWAIGASWLTRAKITLVMGVLIAGAGVAVLGMAPSKQPESPQESAKPAAETKQPRVDRYGDPLPDGALARLGTMRFRHANGTTLAFAPDSKSLLTCGADRLIRTWDTASGRLLGEQRLPAEPYTPVFVLSPDGRLLAYQDASMDTFRLWDVTRKQLRHKLPLGEKGWHKAIFSPDGKTLVTAQDSGILRAWDVANGRGRLLGQHKENIFSLSFTADGTLMSLCSGDSIRFWDVAGGHERSRLTLPEWAPEAAVSPDGRTIAALRSTGKKMEFFDAATGKPAKGWTAPDLKHIHSVRFAPDGKTVAIGTSAGVSIWDPLAGKSLHMLPGGLGYNLTYSPDGKTLASFATHSPNHPRGTVLHVWDLATGAPHAANSAERGHLDEVDGLAFTPDGRTIASSCSVDRSVRLWDAATGRLLRSLPVKEQLSFHNLFFTPDGKYLLAGTGAAVLRWEVATGREVARYPVFGPSKEDSHHLMVSHLTDDGRTLLALSQNLSRTGAKWGLHTWDAASGKRLRFVPFDENDWLETGYSHFSPDGRWLAPPSGSIRATATGEERLQLPLEAGTYLGNPSAFSRDGALFAAGVWRIIKLPNGQRAEMLAVQVWELATLLPVARLKMDKVAHVVFTPDGRRLIAVGPESLKLWDLASGQVLARRPAPGRFVGSFGPSFASSLALSSDGRTVATGQPDTTILLWNLSPSRSEERPVPLTVARQEACWTDLAGPDGQRALTAIAHLADSPQQTVGLLRSRLRPAKALAAEEARRLLADLDDSQFERREAAAKRLADWGEQADKPLREALTRKPSLEVRRRIEKLLAEPRLVRTPAERRHLRAVRVLESIGTSEARQVLEMLTKGASDSRLTQAAKAALTRLMRPTNP